jgi:hypothetical protein
LWSTSRLKIAVSLRRLSAIATAAKACLARQNRSGDGPGHGTTELIRRSDKAKSMVWRWQARFMAEGVAG